MWLSIQGIYEYDPTVFDGFDAPSYTDPNNVVHVLNKNNVINSICLECAELELLYPSVEMMKFAIGVWSASNYDAFCKMYASQLIKYNPIWNVDATETENETNERDIGRIHTGSNNETRNLTDAETRNLTDAETRNLTDTETRDLTDAETRNLSDAETRNLTDTETRNLTDAETRNITDTESVQGFNSSSWSESKKVVGTGTDTFTHTGTDTTTHTGTDTVNHTGTDTFKHTGTDTTTHTGTDSFTHTGTDTVNHTGTDNVSISNNETINDDNTRTNTKTRTGNIGVTASQDLIKKEREVADFSTIEFITRSFKERFCILVY